MAVAARPSLWKEPSRLHLRRLLLLRAVLWAVALLLVLTAGAVLAVALRVPLALLALWGLASVPAELRLRREAPIGAGLLAAQLLLDVLVLSLLLAWGGGEDNPFMFLLLLPLAFAAAVLPARAALAVAGSAVAGYTAVLLFAHNAPQAFAAPGWARFAMWLCFVLAGSLLMAFLLRTRRSLEHHAQALQHARAQAARAERLAALGRQAAGTAHELGTPLGTMALLVDELAEVEPPRTPDGAAALSQLRTQIYRCKRVLDGLGDAAHRGQPAPAVSVRGWLEGLLEDWRHGAPGRSLPTELGSTDGSEPRIVPDEGLEQALRVLLDNAARVSGEVRCRARWQRRQLTVEVLDRGPGLPAGLRARLGRLPVAGEPEAGGLGLGLYLATGTVEALGGELALAERQGGGTRATLTLPLQPQPDGAQAREA